jgi:hypothetical protein
MKGRPIKSGDQLVDVAPVLDPAPR